MTVTVVGFRTVNAERDDEGFRTYNVVTLCMGDLTDGPANVMQCSDLAQIGDIWSFVTGDVDDFAWCYPTMKVSIHEEKEGDPVIYWRVEQKFSNRPMKRCNTTQIENPLEEPQKISGTFQKYTREVSYDRFGKPLLSSSFEQVHGPGVEFDFNRASVRIEQNVGTLDLALFSGLVDTVNDSTLWGLPKRCVKLSNVSWERKLFGICSYYFTRSFEFDTDYNTFDRNVADEGYKCLYGEWAKTDTDPGLTTYRNGVPLPTGSLWKLLPINGQPPNRANPQHFTRFKDRNGEMGRTLLDGRGEPASLGFTEGTGTGFAIPFWTPNTPYVKGTLVNNGGKIYRAIVYFNGVSGSSGGPTGTGSSIPDGTCLWDFLESAGTAGSEPGNIFVSYYSESNFLLLGIPSNLETGI